MDEQLLQSLADTLQKQFNELAKLTPGSKEYSALVADIRTLWDLGLEETRIRIDADDTLYDRDIEAAKAEEERKNKHFDRVIKIGLDLAAIMVPATIYTVLFFVGLKFEEVGSFSTSWMRNLMGKIRPTK